MFRIALEQGVDVESDGNVYGLLKVHPSCGMTAYRHYTHRVCLTDLAGALEPASLDESLVPREEQEMLAEGTYRPRDPRWVSDHIWSYIGRVRRIRETVEHRPKAANDETRTSRFER